MSTVSGAATLACFTVASGPDAIRSALDRDGAAIVEGLLPLDVVARVNDEVEAAVAAADPAEVLFNPVMSAFHGPFTRQVSGMPGISRTFAVDVMCHPLLLALCDRILAPSCARYQLNIGHLLQRGPGSEEQWLHRDESVWSDVPRPAPELQLATVIAFVDFTRDNGATRSCPAATAGPTARSCRASRCASSRRGPSRSPTRRCRPGARWCTPAARSTAGARTSPTSLGGART